METEKNKEFFTEFRKLQNCVATLIRCQSYLQVDDRKAIVALMDLARKLEVSSLIQQRDIIAVAGMQGTGKSTLVKNLYNLPDNILRISSERGEKVPVFITECGDLQPGEYRARAVSFQSGEKQISDISVDAVSRTSSRGGDVAYIEVFVPYHCFGRDNAGFVLLPGFEKDADRSFKQDYNSLMEYTLHFANAVVLVTDNSGIANEDICKLVDLLGENFEPGNCVFAITKCDALNQKRSGEQRNSLHTVCKERGLPICLDQIVCTGEYTTEEENRKWKETFLDVVETYVDYNAAKKKYTYFQPMVEEMCNCANRLQEALDLTTFSDDTSSPLYEALKKALNEAENSLAQRLEGPCEETKKQVKMAFEDAYKEVPKEYKRTKKIFFFEKTYSEIAEANRHIEKASLKCLEAGKGQSKFIKQAQVALTSSTEKRRLLEDYITLSQSCLTADAGPQALSLQDGTLRYYLDPTVDKMPQYPNGIYPRIENIAKLITKEFEAFFVGMMSGKVDVDSVPIRTSGVSATLRAVSDAQNNQSNFSAAKVITLIDLLDGTPDILNNVVALFKGGKAAGAVAVDTVAGTAGTAAAGTAAVGTAAGEAGGAAAAGAAGVSAGAVTAACAVVAVAVAIVVGGKMYNSAVRSQNAVALAWENALMNAVEEQKNNCLDAFHDAGVKLLDYVQEVHRYRRRIGDRERRIVEAKYAIDDIRNLANQINDKYADTLQAHC